METPTPRTDASAVLCYGEGGIENSIGFRAVPLESARDLERELFAANAQIMTLRDALKDYMLAMCDGPENCGGVSADRCWENAETALKTFAAKYPTP
jgi:hypothetical protein